MKGLLVAVAVFVLAVLSEAAAAQSGRTVYTSTCASGACHTNNPLNDNHATRGNRLQNCARPLTDLSSSMDCLEGARLLDGAMDAAFSALSNAQVDSVARYLSSVFFPTSAPPPPPPPPATPATPPEAPPPTTTVVEYLHAGFGHYFITSFQAEIDALDAGRVDGWARTGRTFKAYTTGNGNQRIVCRFFTAAFPPKSSHFYTSNSEECGLLRQTSRDWQYEADSFWVQPADAVMGSCRTGTQAVYRLYNDGKSGAPNHRYTADPQLRIEMMGKGWIPEGAGPEGVAFCAPL